MRVVDIVSEPHVIHVGTYRRDCILGVDILERIYEHLKLGRELIAVYGRLYKELMQRHTRLSFREPFTSGHAVFALGQSYMAQRLSYHLIRGFVVVVTGAVLVDAVV